MLKYGALIKDSYVSTNYGQSDTIEFTALKKFKDRAEMEEWVKNHEGLVYSRPTYTVIQYTELKVKTTINIEVEEWSGPPFTF